MNTDNTDAPKFYLYYNPSTCCFVNNIFGGLRA
jgi:hypothetical protein